MHQRQDVSQTESGISTQLNPRICPSNSPFQDNIRHLGSMIRLEIATSSATYRQPERKLCTLL